MEKLGFCGRSCQHFETTLKLSLSLIWLEMLIVCVLETLFISLWLKLGCVEYTSLFLDHFYLKTKSRGDQYYDKEHNFDFYSFSYIFQYGIALLIASSTYGIDLWDPISIHFRSTCIELDRSWEKYRCRGWYSSSGCNLSDSCFTPTIPFMDSHYVFVFVIW